MSKNALTNQIRSDRIIKLSQDGVQQNMPRKKLEKSLKKYLTNEICCVTLIKLPEKRGSKYPEKNFEKLEKST